MRPALSSFACLLALACGSTSGPVLEQIPPRLPPGSNLRVDVLSVRDITSCAIGNPCQSNNPANCFALSDANGPVQTFDPSGIEFVPPDDPRVAQAPRSGCFELLLDDAARSTLEQSFAGLRDEVFQLSEGQIDLDVRIHDLPALTGGFNRWENSTGIFLTPSTLDATGLPLVSRDTDYVFAVTGDGVPAQGLLPNIPYCAGTNWLGKGGFAGSEYTWTTASCATSDLMLWHLLAQTYFGLRDIDAFPDIYQNQFPACGTNRDPSRWFPMPDQCGADPDATSCGTSCSLLP
ncbi:MAG TPA: hypothetical protein VGM29_15755, partial [Polyangiaceae bacterium]